MQRIYIRKAALASLLTNNEHSPVFGCCPSGSGSAKRALPACLFAGRICNRSSSKRRFVVNLISADRHAPHDCFFRKTSARAGRLGRAAAGDGSPRETRSLKSYGTTTGSDGAGWRSDARNDLNEWEQGSERGCARTPLLLAFTTQESRLLVAGHETEQDITGRRQRFFWRGLCQATSYSACQWR